MSWIMSHHEQDQPSLVTCCTHAAFVVINTRVSWGLAPIVCLACFADCTFCYHGLVATLALKTTCRLCTVIITAPTWKTHEAAACSLYVANTVAFRLQVNLERYISSILAHSTSTDQPNSSLQIVRLTVTARTQKTSLSSTLMCRLDRNVLRKQQPRPTPVNTHTCL